MLGWPSRRCTTGSERLSGRLRRRAARAWTAAVGGVSSATPTPATTGGYWHCAGALSCWDTARTYVPLKPPWESILT